MRLIGDGAEVGIDERNHVFNQGPLEGAEVERAASAAARGGGGGRRARRPAMRNEAGRDVVMPFSITMMNGVALPSAIKLSMIRPARP